LTAGQLRPSNKVTVPFDIIKDDNPVSPRNRVFNCYGYPEDGPVELTLRDEDGVVSTFVVVHVTSVEENPHSGYTHFSGELVTGDSISGHFPPGPAATELVGKATVTL